MEDEKASIVLLSSSEPGNDRIGTGFIFHYTATSTYILTAAHVIDDIGIAGIAVDHISVEVISLKKDTNCDVAVLEVTRLYKREKLKRLARKVQFGQALEIFGYYRYTSSAKTAPAFRAVQGSVGEIMQISPSRVAALNLVIESEHTLKPGYSGSPVISKESGNIVGVVTQAQQDGRSGVAISVDILEQLCKDLSKNFFAEETLSEIPFMQGETNPNISLRIYVFFHEKEKRYMQNLEESCLNAFENRGIVEVWHQGKISVGKNRKLEIDENLKRSNIFLIIISSNFISSYYKNTDNIRSQVDWILEQQKLGKGKIVPVLAKQCATWEGVFGDLQPLPKNGKFISDSKSWSNQDSAFFAIAKELQEELGI